MIPSATFLRKKENTKFLQKFWEKSGVIFSLDSIFLARRKCSQNFCELLDIIRNSFSITDYLRKIQIAKMKNEKWKSALVSALLTNVFHFADARFSRLQNLPRTCYFKNNKTIEVHLKGQY